jgi:hypothetical protein
MDRLLGIGSRASLRYVDEVPSRLDIGLDDTILARVLGYEIQG